MKNRDSQRRSIPETQNLFNKLVVNFKLLGNILKGFPTFEASKIL